MDVKAFLNDTRNSLLQVQVLCERAQKYREMAMNASSGQAHEPYVLKLMDAHAELQSKINQFLKDSREAEKLIETLENGKQRAVLQLYYLCGYRWQEVADKTHFTLRWVHKLHVAGIAELERRYTE